MCAKKRPIRFWNRWFANTTAAQLEDWLNSQGRFIGEFVGEEYKGKYDFPALQEMTFYEIFGFEWCAISKKYTGLPVDIYVDEVSIERNTPYEWAKHPKLPPQPKIAAINRYTKGPIDVIPITISKTPEILEDIANVNLTEADIRRLKDFIVSNYDLLMKHWNQEVSTCDLFDIFKQKYQDKQ